MKSELRLKALNDTITDYSLLITCDMMKFSELLNMFCCCGQVRHPGQDGQPGGQGGHLGHKF